MKIAQFKPLSLRREMLAGNLSMDMVVDRGRAGRGNGNGKVAGALEAVDVKALGEDGQVDMADIWMKDLRGLAGILAG